MLREIIIRPMRIDDLDRVYKLEMKLFLNPWPKSFFKNDIRSQDAIAFVVEYQGSIIGYSLSSFVNAGFHITNIAIDKEYQRQGIASTLMQKLENIATENSCHYIYLEVRTNNTAAIDLYKSLGYDILFKRRYYYIDGDDAYVMDKELDF